MKVAEIYNDNYAKGKVCEQAPKGGSKLKKGDTVIIYVSKGSKNGNTSSTGKNTSSTSSKNVSSGTNTDASTNADTETTTQTPGNTDTTNHDNTDTSKNQDINTNSEANSDQSSSNEIIESQESENNEQANIKITESSITLTVDDVCYLYAETNYDYDSIKWKSSNPDIVSVAEMSGRVKAKAKGEATITVTADGHEATCTVYVNAPTGKDGTEVIDSGSCGDNVQWQLCASGTLYIYGDGNMTDWNSDMGENTPWHNYSDTIQNITVEDNITRIGSSAFRWCDNLSSINITNSLTSIGAAAFANCRRLESISIPNTVTSIGEDAFSYCESLNEVYFKGDKPEMNNSFGGCENVKIYYPKDNESWSNVDKNWNGGGNVTFEPYDP